MKRKRLEEDNCNNVPKRLKLHAERQHEFGETHQNLSAEYMRNYRKRKAQENKTPQASMSTDRTSIPIMYNYNICPTTHNLMERRRKIKLSL
jgi:hypothetical protein